MSAVFGKIAALHRRLHAFWMKMPEKARFVLVGGWNSVFSYLLYALFLSCMDAEYPQIALLCAFLASSVPNFATQKIYVFGTRGNWIGEYLKCLVVWSVGYGANGCMLALFTRVMRIDPYVAGIYSELAAAIVAYVLFKHFAFARAKSKPTA
ncbi:MAG: GtrA family protein [Rickettsiales bacterium]|jgi:putative flippase GtrA|nr:GtrA family protein [Rickettsiales bacterium]